MNLGIRILGLLAYLSWITYEIIVENFPNYIIF